VRRIRGIEDIPSLLGVGGEIEAVPIEAVPGAEAVPPIPIGTNSSQARRRRTPRHVLTPRRWTLQDELAVDAIHMLRFLLAPA
jgi:hypothetical protein